MLVAVPLVIPWTEQTVLNPHEGRYKTERALLNENWSQWLLVGYLISGSKQVFEAKRPKLLELAFGRLARSTANIVLSTRQMAKSLQKPGSGYS